MLHRLFVSCLDGVNILSMIKAMCEVSRREEGRIACARGPSVTRYSLMRCE